MPFLINIAIFVANMGILYIVPTPVGNMEDMTMRAIRILKEADLVLAEDTRTSGILLKHFDIQNRLMSHHKFNEHGTSAAIVERLKAGETIALISDRRHSRHQRPGILSRTRGCQGWNNGAMSARCYGICASHCQFRTALRPLLL